MQEKTKTTAQVLVDCLEAEGVDVMFGIPGEETLDLMFAIRDSEPEFALKLRETMVAEHAAMAADGAQRDRSPCGLQRKHEAFCPLEGGIPAKRDLSFALIAEHPRQRLPLPGVFFL